MSTYCEFKVQNIDYDAVLSVLARHVPENASLVLEGGAASGDLASFLKPFSSDLPDSVNRGTIWPRQSIYTIPKATDALTRLAEFADSYAEPEICSHLFILVDGKLILEWNDFGSDSFYVREDYGEIEVQGLAEDLGCKIDHHSVPE